MKVLHVTPSFYPAFVYGGPTRTVHQLCVALAGAGCDVRVLTTDANGPAAVLNVETSRDIELCKGMRVRYCHRVKDVSVSPELLLHLTSYVRWADVIHLTAVYSFPTIPTLLAARLYGKPLVWSPRGMLQRWSGSSRPHLKSVWERVCRLVAPDRLSLHVTSEIEGGESVERLPDVETVLVPNGVDVPDSVSHMPGAGELRVVYLGRLDPKKGIENLLAACRMADSQLAGEYSLKIAGGGAESYIASIEALIGSEGLSDRVQLVGEVEGGAKSRLFATADVVVVPSHTENFGLVVAEALAHGVPVIASKGTPWKRVQDMGCGLWVDNRPESLSRALISARAMPLRQMGERGRAWMRSEFTWPNVGSQMVRHYSQLVANDTAPSRKEATGSAVVKDA